MAGGSTPPGWYAAEGDPPGTQRWWDGNQWVGEPQPIPSAAMPEPAPMPEVTPPSIPDMPEIPEVGSPSSTMPLLPGSGGVQDGVPSAATPPAGMAPSGAFPGAPMPAPAGSMPGMYPESSKATLALVLSIVGFFLCGILSVVGLVLGWQERAAIDAGRRDPNNRGQAVAAIVIGGIITALMVLLFLFVIVLVIFGSA